MRKTKQKQPRIITTFYAPRSRLECRELLYQNQAVIGQGKWQATFKPSEVIFQRRIFPFGFMLPFITMPIGQAAGKPHRITLHVNLERVHKQATRITIGDAASYYLLMLLISIFSLLGIVFLTGQSDSRICMGGAVIFHIVSFWLLYWLPLRRAKKTTHSKYGCAAGA